MTRTPSFPRLQVEELEGREVPAILFGVTPANQVVTFDSAAPNVLLNSTPIFGLASGEVITDIDVRTATGALFGHSNLGQLYQIDPLSGIALQIGTPIPPGAINLGFDFDPKADRIRLLTNQGENLIREPVFGLLVRRATPLSYAPGDRFEGIAPRVTGAAFFNNVPNPPFRLLYAIDHSLNALARVGRTSLDDGLLTTIGGLGLDVTNRVGFDIAPETNAMFASLQVAGQSFSRLYTIRYVDGRAIPVGSIGGGLLLNDIAVDLAGISGFESAAGFGVFAPPGSGSGFSPITFNPIAFNAINFPALASPFGTPLTTTTPFPAAPPPISTTTSPFFVGTTGTTDTTGVVTF